MRPYVIRQGDYVAKLAHRFGFDAQSVWMDPANAKLRAARPNPNILAPFDLLWIPEPKPPAWHPVVLGTENVFVASSPPTTSITLKFLDDSLASQPVTIKELPTLTGLATGVDGSLTFDLPVCAEVVTVVFTKLGVIHECRVGHVDPIDTLAGVFCRLQNLGYLGVDTTLAATDIESIRAALRAFNADRGAAPSSRQSAPQPPDTPQAPAFHLTPHAATALPSPCPLPEHDDPSGGGDEGAAVPSSTTAPALDDAGLADDGTLDASTRQALVQAHGS